MATEVIMPVLGLTMETGTIVEWLKGEGETVTEDDILFTVETDKSVMEVEAKVSGTLLKVLNGPGDEVPVQQVIAYIGVAGESISEPEETVGNGAVASKPAIALTPNLPSTTPQPASRTGRVKSSPAARSYAKQHSIVVEEVTGTGPGGRIVKSDVEAFAQQQTESPATSVGTSAPSTFQSLGTKDQGGKLEKSRSKLSGIRKITATRLAESASTIPHFFVSMEIDMTRAVTLRQELNEYGESHSLSKVSVNDMIIRATALALKESPAVNASLDGDTIIQYADINVGFAVALDDGLVVPVVTASDQKSVYDIAGATKALDAKAKSGGLSPDDYGHGTFTISNLGMFGVDQFTAIINPPEAAILAVGRVKETPAVVDGAITTRSVMVLTLSSDHRLIDGAVAARFLSQIRDLLEQPIGLLLT